MDQVRNVGDRLQDDLGAVKAQPPAAAPGVSGFEQPSLRALASLPRLLSQAGSSKTSWILALSEVIASVSEVHWAIGGLGEKPARA